MNWYKQISANITIVNDIVSLLLNAYNNSGFIDESKIYSIKSQIPDETTFDNMLQKAISIVSQMLKIDQLSVSQNQIIEQLRNNFNSPVQPIPDQPEEISE